MKTQIKRLSVHQNAKVFAILMAVSSLILVLPLFAFNMLFMPPMEMEPQAFPGILPGFAVLLMPVFYLIFSYIAVAIGCLIYNLLAGFIGGIEFEMEDVEP